MITNWQHLSNRWFVERVGVFKRKPIKPKLELELQHKDVQKRYIQIQTILKALHPTIASIRPPIPVVGFPPTEASFRHMDYEDHRHNNINTPTNNRYLVNVWLRLPDTCAGESDKSERGYRCGQSREAESRSGQSAYLAVADQIHRWTNLVPPRRCSSTKNQSSIGSRCVRSWSASQCRSFVVVGWGVGGGGGGGRSVGVSGISTTRFSRNLVSMHFTFFCAERTAFGQNAAVAPV